MSQQTNDRMKEKERCMGLGMALGLAMFAPIGIVLSIVTDNPGLLGVGPAIGTSIGVAIGEHLYKRSKQ
ncbi:MAG: hypothetical protein AMJ88_03680 [Anaerolineae bacterium SM23_ 63]|nr:MAG: hypothetical protein AMJ88_03680 [Anaerolineae bacterium SM23_ 63]HEY45931.1 hypothetical protein [Anaerolineae bacterium]